MELVSVSPQSTSSGGDGSVVPVLLGASSSNLPAEQAPRLIPVSIPESQRYYWTWMWQAGERETVQDLQRGDFEEFDTTDDLIRWLLSSQDD